VRKHTTKVNGLVDWTEETKKYLHSTKYSYNTYCTLKKALEECGLERIDDGCLSSYKMGGVSIDFDPTWGSLTLSSSELEDYDISYQEPSYIIEHFFLELRNYWKRHENKTS